MKLTKNPYPETTDDSKSWYRSKLSDGGYSSKLFAENSELLKRTSPRSVTPNKRDVEETDTKSIPFKPKDVPSEADLPGFFAKTSQQADEHRFEKDIHFEAEFPTFSAYLKRTYGQTYQYRTPREDSGIDNTEMSSFEPEFQRRSSKILTLSG